MNKQLFLIMVGLLLLAQTGAWAQGSYSASNNVVNYEEIADLPYGINRMWLHFQPITADMFLTNLSIGPGLQANVYATDKLEFAMSFRVPYGEKFDMNRWAANRNTQLRLPSDNSTEEAVFTTENEFKTFTYFELTGCYHFVDKEEKGLSKVMLTSKKTKLLEYTNIGRIDVNSNVRKIIGARGGVMHYATTANLTSAMEKLDLTLVNDNEGPKPFRTDDIVYSSLSVTALVLGANYGSIRNISVDADKFGSLANNTIFNSYFDLMISMPAMMVLDDLSVRNSSQPTATVDIWSVEQIRENMNWFGFRGGFDIFYNQDVFWSFGGEAGLRPSIARQGWYAMFKIGLPAFSFKFKQARTANNTGALKRR